MTHKLENNYNAEELSKVPLMVKNPSANSGDARDTDSIPGLGRSPGVGNSNLFQYSSLENSMGRGALQAPVFGATKSWTRLSEHKERFPTGTRVLSPISGSQTWGFGTGKKKAQRAWLCRPLGLNFRSPRGLEE